MMRSYQFVTILVAVFTVALSAGLMIGCDNNSVDSPENDATLMNSGVPNIVETDICRVVNPRLQDEVPAINERLEQARAIPLVKTTMDQFETHFSYAPQYSFILSGDVVPEGSDDTVAVEVITLAMTYDVDMMERVVYVSYTLAHDLGVAVEAAEVAFIPEIAEDG